MSVDEVEGCLAVAEVEAPKDHTHVQVLQHLGNLQVSFFSNRANILFWKKNAERKRSYNSVVHVSSSDLRGV